MGDGGVWVRAQAFLLAENSHTPISYFLEISLIALTKWISTNNSIHKQREQQREQLKKQQQPRKRGRRR